MRIMRWTLSKTLVLVSVATSAALDDMGEQRSPKKLPERMAPPMRAGLTPMAVPMAMQMTPMVAAVPNELPMSIDMPQHKRKVAGTRVVGEAGKHGDGAGGTPGGGEHADDEEEEVDVADGAQALEGHAEQVTDLVTVVKAVVEEEGVANKEGEGDGRADCQRGDKRCRKQSDDANLIHGDAPFLDMLRYDSASLKSNCYY